MPDPVGFVFYVGIISADVTGLKIWDGLRGGLKPRPFKAKRNVEAKRAVENPEGMAGRGVRSCPGGVRVLCPEGGRAVGEFRRSRESKG
jgi:hypothetical protein